MSTPMIAITTRSSISVKPIRRVNHDFFIIDSLQDKNMKKRKLKLQNSIGKREKTRREDCFWLGAFSFSFHHAGRLSGNVTQGSISHFFGANSGMHKLQAIPAGGLANKNRAPLSRTPAPSHGFPD